jgi:hypothetical protein
VRILKLTKEQLYDAVMQMKNYHEQHSGGGGVSFLTALQDVGCDCPEDGQTLVFSTEDNLWHNKYISGGGGGGSLVIDTLWDEIIDSTGTYTLAKSIDNYDFLIASAWGCAEGNSYEQSNYIVIPKKDYYIRSTYAEDIGWAFCINTSIAGYTRRSIFQFDDDTTLNIANQTNSKFRALYGVKLDSGGSGGGSGGSIQRTVIWEGTVTNVGDSGICSQSIEDFDFLLAYGIPLDVQTETHLQWLSVNDIKKNYGVANFSYEYYDTIYIRCAFIDDKTFQCLQSAYIGVSVFAYTKIEGIKFQSGGGISSEDIELTKAEYKALPDTKLSDNKNYFITDGNGKYGVLMRNGINYSGGWKYLYTIRTVSTGGYDASVSVNDTVYLYSDVANTPTTIDNVLLLEHGNLFWTLTALVPVIDSDGNFYQANAIISTWKYLDTIDINLDLSEDTYWSMPILSSDIQDIDGVTYSVTADSCHNSMLPWLAFDGIDASTLATQGKSWHSARATTYGTHWIMLTISKGIAITSFTIKHRYTSNSMENHNLKEFIFEGSNDGETWIELLHDTCIGTPATSESFSINNTTRYTQYRIREITTYSVYSYECYLVIGELTFEGLIKI